MAKLRLPASDGGPPPRTPARQALANAIERRRVEEARRSDLHDRHAAARNVMDAASAAVDQAADNVQDAVRGETGLTVTAAMAAAQTARLELEAARMVERLSEERLAAETNSYRRDEVGPAAVDVLRESGAAVVLLDDVERLLRELIAKGRALMRLAEIEVIPNGYPLPGRGFPVGDQTEGGRCREAVHIVRHLNGTELWQTAALAGERAWDAAMAALASDPDAPLPEYAP